MIRNFLSRRTLVVVACNRAYFPKPSPLPIVVRVSLLNFSILHDKGPFEMGGSSGKFQVNKPFYDKPQNTKITTMCEEEDSYIERVVCHVDDLQENKPKVVEIQEETRDECAEEAKKHKVLLIKQNGNIHALGTKCSHYGAPLETGAVGEGRIRCPWHGACFNIATGDIEDFPGLDSLPCYEVRVDESNVKVKVKKSDLGVTKRVKGMAKRDSANSEAFVIVGGGPAGQVCAETLRQNNYKGRVVLITKEKYLPYDRIKLTKDMAVDIDSIQLRNKDFYRENDIEVLLNTEVCGFDVSKKQVTLSDKKTVCYSKLFLATGASPRTPEIPGICLQNIFTVRSYDDAKKIQALIGGEKEVVILGSGFIGMECAASLSGKVRLITVVGQSQYPLGNVFGDKIGNALKNLFLQKNVQFCLKNTIKEFVSDEKGAVKSVELKDGTILKADFCIVALGNTFNTDFFPSEVVRNQDGTVEVNEFLETNVANVYAGGDIAKAPIFDYPGKKASIGHWGLAHYHGRIAALNMLNKKSPIRSVPFFWTVLFGKSIRYAGHGDYEEVEYVGDVDNLKFVAMYLKKDTVVAIASCQMDPIVAKWAELTMQGKKVTRCDMLPKPLSWAEEGEEKK